MNVDTNWLITGMASGSGIAMIAMWFLKYISAHSRCRGRFTVDAGDDIPSPV